MTDTSRLGALHQLHLHELVMPTGLIDDVRRQLIDPYRQRVRAAISQMLGTRPDHLAVAQCELSIIGQCRSDETDAPQQ